MSSINSIMHTVIRPGIHTINRELGMVLGDPARAQDIIMLHYVIYTQSALTQHEKF